MPPEINQTPQQHQLQSPGNPKTAFWSFRCSYYRQRDDRNIKDWEDRKQGHTRPEGLLVRDQLFKPYKEVLQLLKDHKTFEIFSNPLDYVQIPEGSERWCMHP